MGRLSRAEEAKQRAAKRQLQFGSAETNAAKPNHEGLIDDAGRMIGSGILRDGVLYTEITPGGGTPIRAKAIASEITDPLTRSSGIIIGKSADLGTNSSGITVSKIPDRQTSRQ